LSAKLPANVPAATATMFENQSAQDMKNKSPFVEGTKGKKDN
jgi:hypothetical protein